MPNCRIAFVQSANCNIYYRLFIFIFLICAILFFLLGAPAWTAQAGVPTGYSEYFIPGSTDQLFQILQDNDNDPQLGNAFGVGTCATGTTECNEMHNITTVSIATDGVIIYYDHWENGYGIGSSGVDETYIGNTGDVLTFESGDILVPRLAGNTCTSTNPGGASTACYDGRDRIFVAGGAVSVAQVFWPETTDTVYANAWEVYPVKPYQTSYTIPVGEDMVAQGYTDFTQVFVIVQAMQDGTLVEIDNPGVPGVDVSTSLNRGQVTQLFHVNTGTTVQASAPVQVQFIVGQPWAGAYSDSRSHTAVPSSLWETSYYNPVPSFTASNEVEIYIYNPTAASLTINYTDSTGSGSFAVPANSTRGFLDLAGHEVPLNSAVYLEAADGVTPFWAIGSADTESASFNYGFTLIPPAQLTAEYYLSWAPGTTDFSANGSPLFVTPTQDNTTFFVDFSPTDGNVDVFYTLDRVQTQRIFDPDNDNTGMHVWATHPFAAVWGEDAGTASLNNPFIDAGYTLLPLNSEWMDIVSTVEKSANPAAIPDGPGQITTFTIRFQTETFSLDDVTIVDRLPPNWDYIAGSSIITLPDATSISGDPADPDVAGSDLTWDDFPAGALDMGPDEALTIEFRAITTGSPPLGYSINHVTGSGRRDGETFVAIDAATVYVSQLEVSKTSSASGSVYPGDSILYTITIENSGTSLQNDLVVTDFLPAGTTYIPGTSQVTAPGPGSTLSYLDQFSSAAYNNSNGSAVWASSWVEGGSETGNNPSAGQITIAGGELLFDGTSNTNIFSLARTADLSGVIDADLSFTYDDDGTLEAEDVVLVEIWDGSAWHGLLSLTDNFTGPLNFNQDITQWANASTAVRFTVTGYAGTGENFAVDNVQIQFTRPGTPVTNPGNPPPSLVAAGDNYDLAAGGVMSIEFQVSVDDPIAAGVAEIANTVSVLSNEQPEPLEDTVSNPLPPSVIGDLVWLDADADGTFDVGETGLAGVTINLYDPGADGVIGGGDDALVATTLTDANGLYSFTVPAGAYYVDADGGLPAGLVLSPGMTDPRGVLTTVAEQAHLDQDFGYCAPAAIGDRIWHDDDLDGMQDAGEPGLGGVAVDLFLDRDGDGVAEPNGDDGAPLSTTLTIVDGSYQFAELQPGFYFVGFEQPFGYSFTLQDAASEDLDSDANLGTGATAITWLAPGASHADTDGGLVSSLDYGDLPDIYDITVLGEDGARHSVGSLRLGAGLETDPNGQESSGATGDLFDDGVLRNATRWTNGATVDLTLDLQGSTASGLADVGIWIDWAGNGVFEPADFFAFPGLTVGSVNTVQVSVPDSGIYSTGSTLNVRVRAFDPASLPGGSLDESDSAGEASNGEVEDYQWAFGPTAVRLSRFGARSVSADWPVWLAVGLLASLAAVGLGWKRRRS